MLVITDAKTLIIPYLIYCDCCQRYNVYMYRPRRISFLSSAIYTYFFIGRGKGHFLSVIRKVKISIILVL